MTNLQKCVFVFVGAVKPIDAILMRAEHLQRAAFPSFVVLAEVVWMQAFALRSLFRRHEPLVSGDRTSDRLFVFALVYQFKTFEFGLDFLENRMNSQQTV